MAVDICTQVNIGMFWIINSLVMLLAGVVSYYFFERRPVGFLVFPIIYIGVSTVILYAVAGG